MITLFQKNKFYLHNSNSIYHTLSDNLEYIEVFDLMFCGIYKTKLYTPVEKIYNKLTEISDKEVMRLINKCYEDRIEFLLQN